LAQVAARVGFGPHKNVWKKDLNEWTIEAIYTKEEVSLFV
jgi:hypothetical protein